MHNKLFVIPTTYNDVLFVFSIDDCSRDPLFLPFAFTLVCLKVRKRRKKKSTISGEIAVIEALFFLREKILS